MCKFNKISLYSAFFLTLALGNTSFVSAQIVYAEGYLYNNFERYLLKIDLATCTVCAIEPELITNSYVGGFTVLQDGTILKYYGTPGIFHLEMPPSIEVIWSGPAGGGGNFVQDGVLAPNGLLYMTAQDGLYTFDASTHTVTYIGPWPAGGACTNLFYLNGVLHGYWFPNAGGNSFDLIVNVTNPAASVFGVPNPPFSHQARELTWNGINGVAYLIPGIGFGPSIIKFYDPATGAITDICTFLPPIRIIAISTAPPSVPEFPCVDPCVTTDAGSFNNIGPYLACNSIFFPAVTNYDINPSEVINYILYTDPADPLGSIISTSTGSYFFYNPATMATGVNYYAAAIGGNNMNGSVVLTDPCIDVSDSIIVQFKNRPTVSFTASPSEICAGGCQTLTATFTGDPPFTLSGQILSGSTVVGTFNQVFSGNVGTFDVCAPANVPPGNIQVQATSLVDANCNCN